MRNLKRLDTVWFWMFLACLALTSMVVTHHYMPLYIVSIVLYVLLCRLAALRIYDSLFLRRIMPTWYKFGWLVYNLLVIPPTTHFTINSFNKGNMVEFGFWVISYICIIAFSFLMFKQRNTDLALKFLNARKNPKS